ncbi:hypothetical protein C8Q70DRAFT_1121372 [Cubamyces menziesii]|nr:hypothetical protein C8Q70DRAFT_1121372 [Cubamyces menziesii]
MLPFQAEGLVSFGTMSLLTLLALNLPGVLANPASAALALARIYTIVWTHKARLSSWIVSHPGPLIRWTTFVAAPGLWHVVWCEVLPGALLLTFWLLADIVYPLWRRSAACVLALGELSDVAWIAVCAVFTLTGFLALATVTLSFFLARILAASWGYVLHTLCTCLHTLRSAYSRVHHRGKVATSTCISRVKSTVLRCITGIRGVLCLQASRFHSLACSLASSVVAACKVTVNVATYQGSKLTLAFCATVSRLWWHFLALHDRVLLWAFAKLDYVNLEGRRLSRRLLNKATKLGVIFVQEPGLSGCAVAPTLQALQSGSDVTEILTLMPFLSLSCGDVSALLSLFHSLTSWRKRTRTCDSTMKSSDSLQDTGHDPDATLTSIDDFEDATCCESEETCLESSSFEFDVSELLGGTPSNSVVPLDRAPRARIARSLSSDSVFADFARPRFAPLAYLPRVNDSLFRARPPLPSLMPKVEEALIGPTTLSPRSELPRDQTKANVMRADHPTEQVLDLGLDQDTGYDLGDLGLPPYKRTRRAGKKEMVDRAAANAMMQAVATAATNAAAEFAGRNGEPFKVFVERAGGVPAADEVAFD